MLSVAAFSQTVLTSIEGNRVDLAAQKGKVVVLAVGAAWLPLSTKQADFTNALAKSYAGKNVVFYYVITDSIDPKSKNFANEAGIRKFVSDKKLTMPVLRDSDGLITTKAFKVEQVPSFVILDKTGKPSVEPFGGIDPKFDLTGPISKLIDKLL